jgi:hypothetical protein
MRNATLLVLIGFLTLLSSCRKDFEFEPSTGDLRFSKDTVYLDTVFTNIGSSTYTLKVYNHSNKDIKIPTIRLGKGLGSKYRMTVDGMTGNQGKMFENVELLAKDSLYIFIEVTADAASANPSDFLYTDEIQFDSGSNLQTVQLVTLIQDAVFLYPQRFDDGTTESLHIGDDDIYGFVLDHSDHNDEYHFTRDKPYVIYGYAAVPDGETLTIDPGAHVHFHDSSGIIVASGGHLQVGGDSALPEDEVVFEGDRLEPDFSDIPGQWGTIWLTSGTGGSSFNHATIKNGIIGLYVQNNAGNLSLKNTKILDHTNYGILAQTANITGENLVINSAGQATLACSLGGSYLFKHCTINNNWPSSQQFALTIDNYYTDDQGNHAYPLTLAEFDNCIIYSSNSRAMSIAKDDSQPFEYQFHNDVLRFSTFGFEDAPLYQFGDNVHYFGMTLSTDYDYPKFLDISKNQLQIDDSSGAVGKGDPAYLVPGDITGAPRTSPPDAGAYQHAPFPESD